MLGGVLRRARRARCHQAGRRTSTSVLCATTTPQATTTASGRVRGVRPSSRGASKVRAKNIHLFSYNHKGATFLPAFMFSFCRDFVRCSWPFLRHSESCFHAKYVIKYNLRVFSWTQSLGFLFLGMFICCRFKDGSVSQSTTPAKSWGILIKLTWFDDPIKYVNSYQIDWHISVQTFMVPRQPTDFSPSAILVFVIFL